MGEIQPKTCEGRELTKNQLEPAAAATAAAAASTVWCELPYAGPTASPPPVARENWEEKVSNW